MELKIKGKKYQVHELLACEYDEITKIENKTENIVALIKKSVNMSDEDYNQITLRERNEIMKLINEANGWNKDFQKSETEDTTD